MGELEEASSDRFISQWAREPGHLRVWVGWQVSRQKGKMKNGNFGEESTREIWRGCWLGETCSYA